MPKYQAIIITSWQTCVTPKKKKNDADKKPL